MIAIVIIHISLCFMFSCENTREIVENCVCLHLTRLWDRRITQFYLILHYPERKQTEEPIAQSGN